MNKESKAVIAEYLSSLSEEDFRFLNVRLNDLLFGDLAELLEFLSKDREIDAILAEAATADDLFDLCDEIKECCGREARKFSKER